MTGLIYSVDALVLNLFYNGLRTEKTTPAGTTRYYSDVVKMISDAGTVANSYTYDEWGNVVEKAETVENPIKYAGEYYDDET